MGISARDRSISSSVPSPCFAARGDRRLDLGVGWLCEALDSGDVDDDLRRGARSILDALPWSFSEPHALSEYPDEAIAAEQLLKLLTDRASTLDDLITAYELGVFLEPTGFGDARVKRVRKLSRAIVAAA